MYYVFSKSSIGYSHIKENKPCQDYSSSYQDIKKTIITCCDGHGGKLYIRSDRGSCFASYALTTVLNMILPKDINNLYITNNEEAFNKLKLLLLCEWNRLVENDISHRPLRKNECKKLNENEIDILKNNFVKAYGTTLTGALLYKDKMLIIGIGDTECLYLKDNKLHKVFELEDEPVANTTYSMCQEDAYKYINVKVLNTKDIDALFLCTDGLTNPYQSYDNFKEYFIDPLMNKIIKEKDLKYIDNFIDELAKKKGIGDDVSLSFIINDKCSSIYNE